MSNKIQATSDKQEGKESKSTLVSCRMFLVAKVFLVACLLLLVAIPTFAAEIFYDAEIKEVRIGSEFEIGIFLNADKENINALEGVLQFPPDLLEFKKIHDGNSIINFWVERPHQRQETRDKRQGEVTFSGIIPGGYQGERGLLFSIIFQAKQEGNGEIEIREAKALLNDGSGTPTKVTVKNLLVSIRPDISVPSWVSPQDAEPPESFAPEIASDPTIFDGKRFLVFATQDKESGIDHYEIKETRGKIQGTRIWPWGWKVAESPYILQDQELRSYVFVKAVDKAGNTRVAKILPQNPLRWYENYENWVIIIIGLAIAYAIWRVIRSKRQGARINYDGE